MIPVPSADPQKTCYIPNFLLFLNLDILFKSMIKKWRSNLSSNTSLSWIWRTYTINVFKSGLLHICLSTNTRKFIFIEVQFLPRLWYLKPLSEFFHKDCIPIEIFYNTPHNINIYLTERARFEDRTVDYTSFFTHTLSLYSIPPYKIAPTSPSKLSRELVLTFKNRLEILLSVSFLNL